MSRKKRESRNHPRRIIRRPINNLEPKTEGQQAYLGLIENCDIVICNGVAGTGKTIIAIGAALRFLYEQPDRYKKLIIVRPAVTVQDEEIGYLPGDIDDKMRPFIAPMMDSMNYFLHPNEILSLFESGIMEVVPLSYMRGRTFNNCVLICDEAQNATPAQMRMVLTRIGFGTKAIIEGDVSQSDLIGDARINNGLRDIMNRFSTPNVLEGFGIAQLSSMDVIRSPIVRKLLTRYE